MPFCEATPTAWALVQTKPHVAVLMVSHDRARIKDESRILAEVVNEDDRPVEHEWDIIRLGPVWA